jgi:glycosyltransferase involved in cell wall biosynthesis
LKLAFVGEGPMRQALEARATALDLAGRVRFLGQWTPVQPFYEAVDCVASPSFTEGLSNVILESLAFGRPVVATAVGGNTEILEHEKSGLVVAPGDPDALATAMGRVFDDERLRARLVDGGLARVRSAFSFEARMRQEEAFYDRVMARRGHRGGSPK